MDSDCSSVTTLPQMRVPLTNLAREADRFGISNRAAAAIATAVLIDLGVVTNTDQSKVIDKNKLKRERMKLRKQLMDNDNQTMNVTSIYFDGRKDETMVKDKQGDRWYSHVTKEEHYVLVSEPGSAYIGHVSTKSSKSIDIADSILSRLKEMELDSSLLVVGCDSTNGNTGARGGVIQYLEKAMRHPLQWFICLLHTNELPLRHLFQKLDGATSGANTFTGSIGQALQSCETKPIVKFKPIVEGDGLPELPQEVLSDLSRDQQYLFNIIRGIREGSVSSNLGKIKPGPLNHSRWLTLANRVCRLYISEQEPDENLRLITHFIVIHYGPCWFAIKCAPSWKHGPKHVHMATQLLKYLPPAVYNIVKPYVARNAYFAHPENVLLAMMTDKDSNKRNKAVNIVLNLRKQNPGIQSQIRKFTVPDINFDARDWDELVNWKTAVITEPPLTLHLSDEEIQAVIDAPLALAKYPNHTQSVERCIKLVSDASKQVYGHNARDGFIRARKSSQGLMPRFDTKKQFAPLIEQSR